MMHITEIEDRADSIAWRYLVSNLATRAAFGTPIDAADLKAILREAQAYANNTVRAPYDLPHSSHVQDQFTSAREWMARISANSK